MGGEHIGRLALDTLTEREQQVLALVAQGLSNAQIAERLVISEKTVRNHITHILAKLGLCTRSELIALVWRNGWVPQP
ncbi:MAG: helix-turn-helix transcriptional regulator [Chloroflexi bacterium]|nr:helix-turn-helix transcriptional regulator [Chloroflexota bacterium]